MSDFLPLKLSQELLELGEVFHPGRLSVQNYFEGDAGLKLEP